MTTSRIEVLTNTDIMSHYSGGNISKIKCRHYKKFCLYQAPPGFGGGSGTVLALKELVAWRQKINRQLQHV